MKTLLLSIVFLFASSFILAQDSDEVQNLINEGIKYHDAGNYKKAIESYKKALKIAPDSYLVNYELGMTYMYAGDFKHALEFTEKAIEVGEDQLGAYMNKGSILDYLNKMDESKKVFKEAEEKFGGNYLLYFNWGLVCFKEKQYAEASALFEKGVILNHAHASGHLYLGFTQANLNNKVKAMLPLYFFLTLEPDSKRSANAISVLRHLYNENVKKTGEKEISITLDSNSLESEFSTVEMILPLMVAASQDPANKDKTEMEKFAEHTGVVFSSLKDMLDTRTEENKETNKFSMWWNFYIPFFNNMTEAGQVEAYSYYINVSIDKDARDWLQQNTEKYDSLNKWLDDYLEAV